MGGTPKDQQVSSSLLAERTVEISATDVVRSLIRIDGGLDYGIAKSVPKYKYVYTSGFTISSSHLVTDVNVTLTDAEESKSSGLGHKQMVFNNSDQFVKLGSRTAPRPAADKAKLNDWLAKHNESSTETKVHEHTFVKTDDLSSNKRLKLAVDSVVESSLTSATSQTNLQQIDTGIMQMPVDSIKTTPFDTPLNSVRQTPPNKPMNKHFKNTHHTPLNTPLNTIQHTPLDTPLNSIQHTPLNTPFSNSVQETPFNTVTKPTPVSPAKEQPPNIRPVNIAKPKAARSLFGGPKQAAKPKSRTNFRQKFLKKMKSIPLNLIKHTRISRRPALCNTMSVKHSHAAQVDKQVDRTSDNQTSRERLILVFKWNKSEMQYSVSRKT